MRKSLTTKSTKYTKGKIGSTLGAFTFVAFVSFVVKNGVPVKNGMRLFLY